MMVSKDDIAREMGAVAFDNALPQDWLDQRVDEIMHRLGYNAREGDTPANHLEAFDLLDSTYQAMRTQVYDAVLGGTVWVYRWGGESAPDVGVGGIPIAVTPIAYALNAMLSATGGKFDDHYISYNPVVRFGEDES